MNQKRHKNINFNTKIENVSPKLQRQQLAFSPSTLWKRKSVSGPCHTHSWELVPHGHIRLTGTSDPRHRKDPCLYGGKVRMNFIKSNLYF